MDGTLGSCFTYQSNLINVTTQIFPLKTYPWFECLSSYLIWTSVIVTSKFLMMLSMSLLRKVSESSLASVLSSFSMSIWSSIFWSLCNLAWDKKWLLLYFSFVFWDNIICLRDCLTFKRYATFDGSFLFLHGQKKISKSF